MEFKTVIGKDKGLANWRLSIKFHHSTYKKYINVDVENFDMGFHDGESFDKIFDYTKGYVGNQKTPYISLITKKGYDYLMTRYDEVVIAFYNCLSEVEKKHQEDYKKEYAKYLASIKTMSDAKQSDLFKPYLREEKLNILI